MSDRTNPWLIVVIVAAVFVGVIMMLGIISAIAIPNLLNAIDRGKQKRTMADVRAIASAIEAYAVDHDAYPTARDLAELEAVLEPRYIEAIPKVDGWEQGLVYESQNPRAVYIIRSHGKDGTPDSPMDGGPTADFDCDIVFAEGQFVQWPQGMQQ